MELKASYLYLAMGSHFDRDDVALPGFASFFKRASAEERDHGAKFIEYQNLRGGTNVLKDINAPDKQAWDSATEAVEDAIELEKAVNMVRKG